MVLRSIGSCNIVVASEAAVTIKIIYIYSNCNSHIGVVSCFAVVVFEVWVVSAVVLAAAVPGAAATERVSTRFSHTYTSI